MTSTRAAVPLSIGQLAAELARMSAPGVLGDYGHFEVTTVFAVQDKGPPKNVFTLVAAEPGPARSPIPPAVPSFLGKRINLPRLKGWMFGIVRYAVTLPSLLQAIQALAAGEPWTLSGQNLVVGRLEAVPPRFAPADQLQPQAWNGVLKNNFWGGSHILELADLDKSGLDPLLDNPTLLQDLSERLRQQVPLEIARASDRLGNILIQLPVTAVMARLDRVGSTGPYELELAWDANVPPRQLRFFTDRQFDGLHRASWSCSATTGTTTVTLPDGRGLETALLWDDAHGLLLWAQAASSRINRLVARGSMTGVATRHFTEPGLPGAGPQSVPLIVHLDPTAVGTGPGIDSDQWAQSRLYREERDRLARERRFVQYVPTSDRRADHQRALSDVRYLLTTYGETAAWLWDPYLTAGDVLETLFHCPHAGADLRALSGAKAVPKPTPETTRGQEQRDTEDGHEALTFADHQRAVFAAHAGDCDSLVLEFRARIGHNGWDFHDRFLIFPDTPQGPLAWSLGTSVNTLGCQHHILQRVDDGRLVADAFVELWDQLDRDEQRVWQVQ